MESIKEIVQRNCVRILDKDDVNISELARLTKISPSTIHKWKDGKHAPEDSNIEKIAEALGIDPIEFYKPREANVKKLPVSELLRRVGYIPDGMYDFFEDYHMDDRAWALVRGFVEEMIPKRKSAARDA